jgi:hypothetical protein
MKNVFNTEDSLKSKVLILDIRSSDVPEWDMEAYDERHDWNVETYEYDLKIDGIYFTVSEVTTNKRIAYLDEVVGSMSFTHDDSKSSVTKTTKLVNLGFNDQDLKFSDLPLSDFTEVLYEFFNSCSSNIRSLTCEVPYQLRELITRKRFYNALN